MASYQYVYTMQGLTKNWPGGKTVLKDINLSFMPGAKIGVLGVNGSGKSTLLKIMGGEITEFGGEAWAAEGLNVGYLRQEPQLDETKTVLGNVMDGVAEKQAILDRYNDISMKFAEPMEDDEMNALIEEQGQLQEEIDAADLWNLDREVDVAMDALRCPPSDSAIDKLSGGERRRVALARLLLSKPDMLLLDEPTNHLDAESVLWLERFLHDYPGTVVAVTHDRYFLDNVAGWILELDRGRGFPYQGNYSGWLEQKAKRLQQESREDESRKRTLASELEWIRQSPRARQAKSKARVSAYEDLLSDESEERRAEMQIYVPPGPRLGSNVIAFENVSKGFGDKFLIDNFTAKIPPGAIVGIIGPNGAGKSTMFRMITGLDTPDSGEVKIGETVKLGFVDQSRDALDPNKNVWEEISGGVDVLEMGKRTIQSRAYVGSFNFKGGDQQKKVGQLSGGERNRVHLARTLKSGANVLLLDEPTNDLDVETLRALEEAMVSFAGCALVISHDRFFLDRIATHILAFEGDSHVEWFEGNFEDYEADRKRRLGDNADQPHRIRYKKLIA